MVMTFDQYIQNPMGIKNAVFSNREMYRELYTNKLNKILVREAGKVEYHLYKAKSKYFAFFKIPSEVVPQFYYDVVIEFSEPDGKTPITLGKYNVRFYSNDPSFVFTFAHAFSKNELFIEEYRDKMPSKALNKNPDEKNPDNQIGYVKSIYFAYLIMIQKGLFNKLLYVESYSQRTVKNMIMNANEKIALRQELGQELQTKKRKSAPKEQKPKETQKSIKGKVNSIVHTKTVKQIKPTKNSSMAKKTKKINKI